MIPGRTFGLGGREPYELRIDRWIDTARVIRVTPVFWLLPEKNCARSRIMHKTATDDVKIEWWTARRKADDKTY